MNPTKNPSAVRSKKVIMETLFMLLKNYSYQEITIKQIIYEAQISRKTFYRNFTSKEDVLISYLDMVLEQYVDEIRKNQAYSIERMLEIIFSFCGNFKDLLLTLRDTELLYLVVMRLNKIIPQQHCEITRRKNKKIKEEQMYLPQYIIAFNIGGIWNVIMEWIKNDMQGDGSDIRKMILRYLKNIKNIDLRDI